jgi:hypothetical protein
VIRHLFFPILPSTGEELAINQLLKVTPVLNEDESSLNDIALSPDSEAHQQFRSMVYFHNKLTDLLSGKGQPIKAIIYGEELALINSLYQHVLVQLQDNPSDIPPNLLNTIQLCQYYCCHLMERYLFSTSFTAEQRHHRFHQGAGWAAKI